MAPFTEDGRREAKKAMEGALSPEKRVYRRMRSGRRAAGFANPSSLEVVHRLFHEIEKAYRIMDAEKLPHNRLNWRIRYCAFTDAGRVNFRYVYPPRVHVTLTTQLAINVLQDLHAIEREDPIFLAIEWDLNQAVWLEAEESAEDVFPDGWDVDWETKFNAYPDKLSEITEVLAAQKAEK